MACGRLDAAPFCVKRKYQLYRSKTCGLIFVWPLPQDTIKVYSEDYFHGAKQGFGYSDYDRDKQPQRKAMERYLDIINEYCPSSYLLDVGAAQGNFLQLATQRGWDVQGIEISDYAASIARQRGIPVKTGTLSQHNDLRPSSFDAVTLWDVFEHLPKPYEDLAIIHRILKPKGILAINTPDSGSWWAHLLGSRWHMILPPEHLNLFSAPAITVLLNNSGYKVNKIYKVGKSFSASYILSILHTWTGHSFFGTLGTRLDKTWLSGISFPINLRDNMLVIAQKINE